jgi:hypothetical protein
VTFRARTLQGLLLVVALLALTSLSACKKRAKMDIPLYPNSQGQVSPPPVESEAGTMFHVIRVTPDGLQTVTEFYRRELVEQRGWSEVKSVGPAFADGNVTVDRPGQMGFATAVDPSIMGGFVVIYASQYETKFEIWQHVPKK